MGRLGCRPSRPHEQRRPGADEHGEAADKQDQMQPTHERSVCRIRESWIAFCGAESGGTDGGRELPPRVARGGEMSANLVMQEDTERSDADC